MRETAAVAVERVQNYWTAALISGDDFCVNGECFHLILSESGL